MEKNKRTCKHCDNKLLARGFCSTHWRRWRNHRDPLKVLRPTKKKEDKQIIIKPDHALLELSSGKFSKIDIEDIEKVKQYNWHFQGKYAHSIIRKKRTDKGKVLYLHRFLMDCPDDMCIDHINMDRLDNRKSNLRLCTISQNSANSKPREGSTSKYKGVSWAKHQQQWTVRIPINGKSTNLGSYWCEIEAAKVYDKKAKEIYGDFAYLNFPNSLH